MKLQRLLPKELGRMLAEPNSDLFGVLVLCFDILGREEIWAQNPVSKSVLVTRQTKKTHTLAINFATLKDASSISPTTLSRPVRIASLSVSVCVIRPSRRFRRL